MFYIECDECGVELRGFSSRPPVPHLCGKCFGSIEYQCADEILEALEVHNDVATPLSERRSIRDEIADIIGRLYNA
jgi:hypothetical protein